MTNNLVTVATLEQINQANRIKGWLEAEGIDSYILNHGLTVEDALQREGQVELQVCENDVSKALEIIGSLEHPVNQRLTVSKRENFLIKKILVPVDFSPEALNAACYAAQVANQKGAVLTLIHVYFNPVTYPVSYDHFYAFPSNVGETLSGIAEDAAERMKEFEHKLKAYLEVHEISAVHIKSEVKGGIAEEIIPEIAEVEKYNLLIVGVQTRESSDNWFGSFVSEIINVSKIPALVIPEKATYKASMFKRLMYATNFDKSDGVAIRKLIEIAKPLETHISVVHIDETSDNPFINYDLVHFKDKSVGEDDQIQMDFDLIVNQDKARGIVNYIADNHIDIIAVTSHKRNIITSLFNPSLTKKLIFRLEIPILIFHAE